MLMKQNVKNDVTKNSPTGKSDLCLLGAVTIPETFPYNWAHSTLLADSSQVQILPVGSGFLAGGTVVLVHQLLQEQQYHTDCQSRAIKIL